MAETITLRWWGPADATSGSRYRVERCLADWTSGWSELAAAQAATSPYVSPNAVLAADVEVGDATISCDDVSSLSASGFGWLNGCLVEWTGQSGGDTLTGCTWHSGAGVSASGTILHEAHESYVDSGVTPTHYAVVYRVTHIDAADRESPPAYAWWHYPPAPDSDEMCVVIFSIGEDFGIAPQENVTIYGKLTTDDQYSGGTGQHLDQESGGNTQVTNSLGLAHFQCRKNRARQTKGGGAATPYAFTINTARAPLTVYIDVVPDEDWVRWCDIGR